MHIKIDDLHHRDVLALLNEHLESMYALSPEESVHALNLGELRAPAVTVWTAWQNDVLLGIGALKELDPSHGEIKSMRTPTSRRRTGAGKAILAHIIYVSRRRGYSQLSLETGSTVDFVPARRLYERFGFTLCGPFGEYREDPNSLFMTRVLQQ